MSFKVGDWVVLTNIEHDSRVCKVVSISETGMSAKPIHPFKHKRKHKNYLG